MLQNGPNRPTIPLLAVKKIDSLVYTIKTWCLKPLRNVLCAIALLLAGSLALLHLPMVQQPLLRSVVNYLYQTTHYHIKCDALRLTWLRNLALEGLTVTDPQGKPLFTVPVCKGRFNLFSLILLQPNMIDSVSVMGGQLYLEKTKDQDFNIATFYTKVILPFLPKSNADLAIHRIQLHGLNLYYHNPINKQAVAVENIDLAIRHFLSSSDHYSGSLTTFSYQETSDIPLVLKNLTAQFSITPHHVVLKNCHLMTKYSNVQGDFTLKQTKQLPLVVDSKNIELEAILRKTLLSSIELSRFSDFFQGAPTLYRLDGVVSLAPHAMAWKNCKLVFGDSCIKSTGCYNGVDADLFVKSGSVYMYDLPKKPTVVPPQLQYISLANATFLGNTQKAKLTGNITTNIGAVAADLMLHHLGKPMQALTGTMTLHKVAIEPLLPVLPIQSISGKVAINIQGDDMGTLDVVAHLTEIETNHYNYKQVKASCMVSNAMAIFKLDSNDPNAKLSVAGRYHRIPQTLLQADGIIEAIHLAKLGFTPKPLSIGSRFSFKISNILSKRPRGALLLNQCIIRGLDKKVACEQVAIHSIAHQNKDLLTLTSPFIDCRLQGMFTMSDLVYHIKHLITRLSNPTDLAPIPAQLHLDYTMNCKKIAAILNWFSDDLYISPAATFSGNFAYDKDYHFSLYLPSASTLCFKKFSLENVKVKFNIDHLIDASKRLIRLDLSSDQQDWRQIFQTEQLSLQLLMHKNKFTIAKRLSNHDNHLSIACLGRLIDGALEIDLLPSTLTTKHHLWKIETEKTSFVSKSELSIGGLSITSGQASIYVRGKLTQSTTSDPLYCTIRQLGLNYVSAVGLIKGIVDSQLVAHLQKDQILVTGRLSLQEAMIQDYAVGTFRTKVDWNLVENTLVLKGKLKKAGKPLLKIAGRYHLLKPSDNLFITTRFDQMDLDLLNPLFASVCSDIDGKLSGQFQLTGSLTAPKLNGKGIIDKGIFKINYLNTCYQVAGGIQVRENRLYADQLALYDGASGHATLSGHMMLQNGFPLRLSGQMEAFHLLHTTRMHNPDFYGDLYATGALQMEGSIYDLLIKMKATTDKGTFTIVAHDKEDIENTTKLVEFVYNKSQKQLGNAPKDEDRSAIKLMLDLTILPTIQAQILFGSYNHKGDSLQGYGTGAIQLEVGTNRKPYVMGNYLFQKGTYTVSVYNLIQKTFTITPNSQVNFNGYPQEGIAHIGASYRQVIAVAELCPQSNDKRPLPVEIVLSAYGTLAHPHIAYQLLFPVKSMDFELNTALEECASKALLDKDYLNKQILSLLIAKRIYNEKKVNGWDALSNSINDFFSQSIQHLLSEISHNLEVEADLGINRSEHQEANILQRPSIKVSYLLLSEHLKLSSTVGRSSRFINDWEIAYRISKTHNMHAKLYQQPLNSANLALFGISLAYTIKFW